MPRWLGPRKGPEPPDAGRRPRPHVPSPPEDDEDVTDDPLAALDAGRRATRGRKHQIYSVSRSVHLPRITLRNGPNASRHDGGGVNPLFRDTTTPPDPSTKPPKTHDKPRQSSPTTSGEKSSSSGYGGSHRSGSLDRPFLDHPPKPLKEDGVTILEQNQNYVKSIKVPPTSSPSSSNGKTKNKSVPSSGSSGGGTLTTIPEGRVDLPVPKPIWPDLPDTKAHYDSIVDDAILLYTSLNYAPTSLTSQQDEGLEVSVKEILVELLRNISATMEGGLGAEEMLRVVNEKVAASVEALRSSTEEEMRKLCVNLSNCGRVNSVLRAFGERRPRSGDVGWRSGRVRTLSGDTDEPSYRGSSSSGFSDSLVDGARFHEDGRNVPKKSSLRAGDGEKPSVWEQYYGVRAHQETIDVKYPAKPTDVPLFPGGRPEADFTLDVPRSEMLLKKMKEDKKWRCRCRLLTSFLGIVFFLLSVMAVSLMLTRGKRMFGSMM